MNATNVRTDQTKNIDSASWVDDYYDRVYPIVLRMVANEDMAKDLTQEVFLRAWEKRESFRGDADIGTWLYRIAVNVTLTYLSRNKNKPPSELDESILADDRDGVHRKLEEADDSNLVKQAVQDLPPHYRISIIMHYYEDMKIDQIAQTLGISKGTVAWRLFKARSILFGSLRAKGIDV